MVNQVMLNSIITYQQLTIMKRIICFHSLSNLSRKQPYDAPEILQNRSLQIDIRRILTYLAYLHMKHGFKRTIILVIYVHNLKNQFGLIR